MSETEIKTTPAFPCILIIHNDRYPQYFIIYSEPELDIACRKIIRQRIIDEFYFDQDLLTAQAIVNKISEIGPAFNFLKKRSNKQYENLSIAYPESIC